MSTSVWMINLAVFAVLLEADLGRRTCGWVRVVRPSLTAAAVVGLYLTRVPSGGNNVALMAAATGVGVVLGCAAHLFVSVGFDSTRGRAGRIVSRAGLGYAGFWMAIFAARLVFVYGSLHWFAGSLGSFLAAHQLSAAALTDALIFMALAMAVARSVVLAGRAAAARRQVAYQLQGA